MKRVLGIIVSMIVLGSLVLCEPGGAQIVRIIPDKSELVPGDSTFLHSEIDNPEASELEYAWEADAGTIENMGDSARWTAPDFLWMDSTATITLTIEDAEGNIDDEDVSLEVQVNRQELEATDDTYTFEHDPGNNYADEIEMMVGHSEDYPGEFFHGFARFPTPTIPEGEELQGARIHLTREWGMEEDCWLDLYLINENWQGSNVTWNNEPEVEPLAFLSINDNSSDKGAFYIRIDDLVEDWIYEGADNYGFMLRLNDESGADQSFRSYVTIEDSDSEEHPVLEVVSW